MLKAYFTFDFDTITQSQLTTAFACSGDFFAFGTLVIVDSGTLLLLKRNRDIPGIKCAIVYTVLIGFILGVSGYLSATQRCIKDSILVVILIQFLFLFTLILKTISYIAPRKNLKTIDLNFA